MVAIAVVINGSGGGIELTAPMVASLMVAAVDGGSDDGIFPTASHKDNRHHPPHRPRPCPPLDEDQMAE